MRRDDTMSVVNVKIERLSTDGLSEKTKVANNLKEATVTTTDGESIRSVRIKKEKSDDPTSSKSIASKNKSATPEYGSKKNASENLNDSIEIVTIETNPTIELSDDESGNTRNDGNKMPPPSFVPPAKVTKEKKAPVEKKIRSTRSKQPKRKVCF